MATQDDVSRLRRSRTGFRHLSQHHAGTARRVPGSDRRDIMALGATLIERAKLEIRPAAARLEGERGRTVTQLRLFAKVVRDGYSSARARFGPAGTHAAASRSAPAQDRPGPGRRLRRQQLPAGVLGRRRRYRLRTGGGLPGHRQGPRRAPGHLGTGRARDPGGSGQLRPAGRHVLDAVRRRPQASASRWSAIRRSRPSASPVRARAAWPWCAPPPARRSRFPCMPK